MVRIEVRKFLFRSMEDGAIIHGGGHCIHNGVVVAGVALCSIMHLAVCV